jgi:hypothetical protein
MTRLPVNASSESMARRIASVAAATLPPEGYFMTVGEIVETESPARPFAKVALQEQNVPAERLSTYLFEVETGRDA